jgi:hypothetical protein
MLFARAVAAREECRINPKELAGCAKARAEFPPKRFRLLNVHPRVGAPVLTSNTIAAMAICEIMDRLRITWH